MTTRRRRTVAFIACWSLLVLPACKRGGDEQSPDEILAAHRDAVAAKLAHIDAIVAQLESLPPLTTDGFTRVPEPAPDFRELDLAARNAEPQHNARVIHVGRLRNLDRATFTDVGNSPGWYLSSRDAITTGTLESYQVAGLLDIERLRYLVVMRPQLERVPTVLTETTFQGGAFQGEALLFEVDTEELLGGLRVSAANADEVRFPSGLADQSAIDDDLRLQVNMALNVAFQHHLPAADVPFERDGNIRRYNPGL